MIPFSLLAHFTTYTSFLCWFQWLPWHVHFPADPGLLSDSMLFLTSQCDSVLPDFTETLQLPSYPHVAAVHISSVLEDGSQGTEPGCWFFSQHCRHLASLLACAVSGVKP